MQEMQGAWVWSLGQDDPLEKEIAAQSSTFAWEIPWTEEPDGLWSMGPQRVGHDCTEHIYITSSEDGIVDNDSYHSECLQEDRLCAKRETI